MHESGYFISSNSQLRILMTYARVHCCLCCVFPVGDNELCPAWASWDKVWWSRHYLRYACYHAKDSFAPVYKNNTSYFDHNALCFNGCTETWAREIETFGKGTELQSTRPYMVILCLYSHYLPDFFPYYFLSDIMLCLLQ